LIIDSVRSVVLHGKGKGERCEQLEPRVLTELSVTGPMCFFVVDRLIVDVLAIGKEWVIWELCCSMVALWCHSTGMSQSHVLVNEG